MDGAPSTGDGAALGSVADSPSAAEGGREDGSDTSTSDWDSLCAWLVGGHGGSAAEHELRGDATTTGRELGGDDNGDRMPNELGDGDDGDGGTRGDDGRSWATTAT
ncbi:Os02g0216866 [Oryza sativa Japonica Group]|jgi:hypothetical protein|nr:hypothetical protein OsJ_05894 [Oryza sativa Japonica Group]BAS77656.1 Os02g0216866 [Oryza sativa Japonica Group]